MIDVWVEIDKGDLARLRSKLSTQRFRRAVRAALNRAGDSSFTAAKRAGAKQLGLPQKRIAADMAKDRSGDDLVYKIKASDRHIPLAEFKARETRKGISAAPWGTRRIFGGTFFAYGGSNVFKRQGPERGPIEGLYGGSVLRELERDAAPGIVREVARQQMQARMQHELNRIFGG